MELPLDVCPVLGKALVHVPFLETRVAPLRQRLAHDLAQLAHQPLSVNWVEVLLFGKGHGEPIFGLRIPLASVNSLAFDEMARDEPNQTGRRCHLSAP